MKRLLLTSGGYYPKKLKKIFLKLVSKKPSEIKVLAMICPKNKTRVIRNPRGVRKQLKKIGILPKNISFVNIMKNISAKSFEKLDFDVFLSWGGNTFLILDRVRKTGFDNFIKKIVGDGRLYVGSSAGSIIVHRTIEIAGWGSECDKNYINLKNLRGLNIVNVAVFPHYHNKLKKEVVEFKKKVKYEVWELRDGEALLILGNKVKKILRS